MKRNLEQESETVGETDLEEDYKPSGFLQGENIILLDLLYSVIIGVMGGIISSLIPFNLFIKVWYPLTGGTQLVSGHHVMWASIVYGLTKKKRNIINTMISKGILEFLLGDPWGILIIIVNIIEGFCLAIGFLIMEKIGEGETKLGWGIAGGLGNFFQAPFFWWLNQRFYLHWTLWALAFIFAFISGILITGLLGRAVKNYLIKAGVPTTDYPQELVYKKLTSEDLPGFNEPKLWSGGVSIDITITSFLLMIFGSVPIIIILMLTLPGNVLEIVSNPYFLIIISLAEILLILLPVRYVGRYLKVPSLKNRFRLLGVTLKGLPKRIGLIKEIMIGILFSIISIFLVFSVSFLVEIFTEFVFGVNIIRNVSSGSGVIFTSSDIIALILIMIVMILVIGPSEEILFRGFLQKGLVRSIGKNAGIIITAIIFSLIHVINSLLLYASGSLSFIISFILSFFPYFAISLLLGLLYYWRKENLIAVILTHGLYNALMILIVLLIS